MPKPLLLALGAALVALIAWLVVPPAEEPVDLADYDRYVYVPDRAAPRVAVIDGWKEILATELALPGIPGPVLVSEDADMLVASLPTERALAFVGLRDQKVPPVLNLGFATDALVVNHRGAELVAVDGAGGRAALVSLDTGSEIRRLEGLEPPLSATFSADGRRLFLTTGEGTVRLLDLPAGTDAGKVKAAGPGGGVSALTRTPDGNMGFVSDADAGSVSVLDLAGRRVMKTLPAGNGASRAYGTASGKYMLVPNQGDDTVSLISMTELDVVATLPGSRDMVSVNTGWFETLAVVLGREKAEAVLLDLDERKEIATLKLPGKPGPGVVTPDGAKLFVALDDTGQVAAIDLKTRSVSKILDDIGRKPFGAVMGRSNNYCH